MANFSIVEDLQWSRDILRDNFNRSYHEHIRSKASRSRVCASALNDSRILHLEANYDLRQGLYVCLREICMCWDTNGGIPLIDNAVCLHLGGSNLVDYCVQPSSNDDDPLQAVVCFLLENGEVRNLLLHTANRSSSIVEFLVLSNEGNAVSLSKPTSLPYPGVSWTEYLFSGVMSSIPKDLSILCASWVSASVLLVGLTKGNVILVQVDGGGMREQSLKDKVGLQAIWSDFMQAPAASNVVDATDGGDVIAATTFTHTPSYATSTSNGGAGSGVFSPLSIGVVLNRNGGIRIWNLNTNKCIDQISITNDLFAAIRYDPLSRIQQRRAILHNAHNVNTKLVPRQIKASIIRAASVPSANDDGSTISIVCTAIEMEVYDEHERLLHFYAQDQSSQSVSRAHQTFWQILVAIYLVPATSTGKKEMQLISEPILFPLSSSEDIDDSAALVDMQLSIEHGALYTVWHRKCGGLGLGLGSDKGSYGSTSTLHYGKTPLPLAALQGPSLSDSLDLNADSVYTPRTQPAGQVGREHDQLYSQSYGEVISGGDAKRLEDEALLSHVGRFPVERVEQCLKIAMLQRIFAPRRFSRSAILAACERILLRVQKSGAGLVIEPSMYYSPVAVMAKLVMSVCEQLALLIQSQSSASSLSSSSSEPFSRSLRAAFLQFLHYCESATVQQSTTVSTGCLALLPRKATSPGGAKSGAPPQLNMYRHLLNQYVIAHVDGAIDINSSFDPFLLCSGSTTTASGQRQISNESASTTHTRRHFWHSISSCITVPPQAYQQLLEIQFAGRGKIRNETDPRTVIQSLTREFAAVSRQYFTVHDTLFPIVTRMPRAGVKPGASITEMQDFREYMDAVLLLPTSALLPLQRVHSASQVVGSRAGGSASLFGDCMEEKQYHCNALEDKYAVNPGVRVRTDIVMDIASSILSMQLQRCHKLLIFLSLVCMDEAREFFSDCAVQVIKDLYLPNTILQFLHLSTLAWMDTVYPTNRYHLLHNTEKLAEASPVSFSHLTFSPHGHGDGDGDGQSRTNPEHAMSGTPPSSSASSSTSSGSYYLHAVSACAADESLSVLHNFFLFTPIASASLVGDTDSDTTSSTTSNTTSNTASSTVLDHQHHLMQSLCANIWFRLRPSMSSLFTNYLFATGQYVCLSNWVALLNLQDETLTISANACATLLPPLQQALRVTSSSSPSSPSSPFSPRFASFFRLFFKFRNVSVKSLSEYHELLRVRSQHMGTDGTRGTGAVAAVGAVKHIESTADNLFSFISPLLDEAWGAASESEVAEQFQSILSFPSEYAASYHEASSECISSALLSLFHYKDEVIGGDDSSDGGYDGEEEREGGQGAPPSSLGNTFAYDGFDAFVNSLYKLRDKPLVKFLCSSVLYSSSSSSSSSSRLVDDSQAMLEFCKKHYIVLLHIISVYYILDVIEVLERSRAVLHGKTGIESAINACTKLVDVIECTLNVLSQVEGSSSVDPDSSADFLGIGIIGALSDELYSGWSRLFEYYLQHGTRYDDALEAVLKLAELDPSYEDSQGDTSAALDSRDIGNIGVNRRLRTRKPHQVSWNTRLRALVSQACDAGYLEWLCTMEDCLVGSTQVHLTAAIALELETLAKDYDIGLEITNDVTGNANTSSASNGSGSSSDSSGGSGSSGGAKRTSKTSNYYECCFAYHSWHLKFRSAAQIFYSLFERSSSELEQRHCTTAVIGFQNRILASAIHCLGLMDPEESFLLYRESYYANNKRKRDSPSKAGGLQSDTVSIVDQQQLTFVYSVKSAIEQLLLRGGDSTVASDVLSLRFHSDSLMRIVQHLCQSGMYNAALSLALQVLHLSKYESASVIANFVTGWSPKDLRSNAKLLEAVVEHLAKECATSLTKTSGASSDSSLYGREAQEGSFKDCFLFSPFFARVSGGLEEASNRSVLLHLLQSDQLLDALISFDNSTLNWSLHHVAVSSILSHDHNAHIPRGLVDSYIRLRTDLGSLSEVPHNGGNPVALIQTFMQHGKMSDACQLSCRLVADFNSSFEASGKPSPSPSPSTGSGRSSSGSSSNSRITAKHKFCTEYYMPYPVFDRVIEVSRRCLENAQTDETEVDLHKHLTRLQRALEAHFELLLVDETFT